MVLVNRSACEEAPAPSWLPARGETAYCIPCAISIPDFKERAPLSHAMPLDEGPQVRAWINGRGYELLRHPSAKAVCVSCGTEVVAAYVPEDR